MVRGPSLIAYPLRMLCDVLLHSLYPVGRGDSCGGTIDVTRFAVDYSILPFELGKPPRNFTEMLADG